MDFIQLLPGFTICLLHLGFVTAENPVLVTGTRGGCAYFPLRSSPAVTWMKTIINSSQMIIIARTNSITEPKYKNRYDLFANGALRLNNIIATDEGTYIAFVENTTALTVRPLFYRLQIRDSVVNGSLGGAAHFNVCVSDENKEKEVIWSYKSYPNLVISEQFEGRAKTYPNGSLMIYHITYNDEGEYIMTDKANPQREESHYLKVYDNLSAPILSSFHQTKIVNGTKVTLRCDAEHNRNVSTYTFHRDRTPICSQPNVICNGSFLNFTPITEKDSGSYTCTIQNPVSSNTSNFLNLTVSSPVSAVTLTSNTSGTLWAEQDSVSLLCTAQGSAITFSWRQNGNPVSSSPPYYITQSDSPPNSTLTISPVSKNDNGPFTCTASNLEDNKTSDDEISLNINWYPEGNIRCTARTTSQTVRLGCSWSGGNPPANVTMIYNDPIGTMLDHVSRNVPSSSIIDGSKLICHGDHLGRTSSCVLKFFLISQQGLPVEVIAGIISGILVGLVIIGLVLYFALRRKKIKPKMLINELNNLSSSSSSHIYENTRPGARIDLTPSSKQDPIHTQKQQQDQSLYCNVLLGRRT